MLYLASRSPRRRQLLSQLGYAFSCLDIDIPEVRAADETPEAYVERVAYDKVCAGWDRLNDAHDVVLAGDTEVVLDEHVFGKPDNADTACDMLKRLSGKEHRVISTVWLKSKTGERTRTCVSRVRFAPLDTASIMAYLATCEFYGKAGGYAIQGARCGLYRTFIGKLFRRYGIAFVRDGTIAASGESFPCVNVINQV